MPDRPPAPQRVPEGSAPAPLIYFDIVPNFGFNVGVANLTLEAVRFTMPGVRPRPTPSRLPR